MFVSSNCHVHYIDLEKKRTRIKINTKSNVNRISAPMVILMDDNYLGGQSLPIFTILDSSMRPFLKSSQLLALAE